ncbi:hypothetical protein BCR36DRAFT_292879, partial [Piromyces finnis]
MKFYISTKAKVDDNENSSENTSDSYLKRFYFDHRILHFVPTSPGDPRITQLVQFPDKNNSQKYGTFKCIPVKSLVIPYGKIILIMTQTVNFFEGGDKNKLAFEIEEINENFEIINNCKSPLHLQSSSPTYIISQDVNEIKPTTNQITENKDKVNDHSPCLTNKI